LEKEQQHAKDETYNKTMWEFIAETVPKIEKSKSIICSLQGAVEECDLTKEASSQP
jgi:hypothetical protein